jgi:hypothetical protein
MIPILAILRFRVGSRDAPPRILVVLNELSDRYAPVTRKDMPTNPEISGLRMLTYVSLRATHMRVISLFLNMSSIMEVQKRKTRSGAESGLTFVNVSNAPSLGPSEIRLMRAHVTKINFARRRRRIDDEARSRRGRQRRGLRSQAVENEHLPYTTDGAQDLCQPRQVQLRLAHWISPIDPDTDTMHFCRLELLL